MRVIDLQLPLHRQPESRSLVYVNVPDSRSKTPPVWVFRICNTNTRNNKEVKERKTGSCADPLQRWYSFCAKFPAVICIVLHLQSAEEPLGVRVQCGHNSGEAETWEEKKQNKKETHQISNPGLHRWFHISVPRRQRSDSQSCGSHRRRGWGGGTPRRHGIHLAPGVRTQRSCTFTTSCDVY